MIGYCKVTAKLLQSKESEIFMIGCNCDCKWCQEGDLNSRPPAYETKTISFIKVLTLLTFNNHKPYKHYTLSTLALNKTNNKNELKTPLLAKISLYYRIYKDIYCKLTANFLINNLINNYQFIYIILTFVLLLVLFFVSMSQTLTSQIIVDF